MFHGMTDEELTEELQPIMKASDDQTIAVEMASKLVRGEKLWPNDNLVILAKEYLQMLELQPRRFHD